MLQQLFYVKCVSMPKGQKIIKLGFFYESTPRLLRKMNLLKLMKLSFSNVTDTGELGLAITATTKRNTEKNYQSYPSEQTRG
jgi:hypothetical protein